MWVVIHFLRRHLYAKFQRQMMHESEGYINAFRQTEGLVRGRP